MVNLLTGPKFQGLAVSKKPDLLTGPVFQRPSVSKKADLLTEPIFQESAVSEKPDLLTEPVFQGSAVSKMVDLLTEDSLLSFCGIEKIAKVICKVLGSPLRNTRHPRQCKRGNRLRWGRTK